MATSKPVPGNQTEWPASDLNLVRDAVVELQGVANGGSQPFGIGGATPLTPVAQGSGQANDGDAWAGIYNDVTFTARGVLNLRFDDGLSTDNSVVLPELLSRNLIASFGIVSGFINLNGSYLTTAQALVMQQAGMEMLCHSATHGADPANLTAFIAETVTAQATLRALGLRADGFIQPGTWLANYLFNTAAKMDNTDAGLTFRNAFAAVSAYIADDQTNVNNVRSIPSVRKYGAVGRTYDTFTLAQAKAEIDGLIAFGGSKQMYIHSNSIGVTFSLADFQAFLTYVQTKRDAGLIELVSMCGLNRGAPGVTRNYIADGNFAASVTGTPAVWVQQGGASWTIDVGSGAGGGNAAKVNSGNYLWQAVNGKNIRSFRVTQQVKNAVGGVTGTARVGVWQYDSAGVQIGSSYTRTKACVDAYATYETNFGIRPDCEYFYYAIFGNDANFVHFSNVSLRKI